MKKSNQFQFKNKFISQIRSETGFGIIEVMVAAGLLLIISVGMTALVTNIQKEQRKQALLQVLVSQKNRFENAFLNPNSWSNTISSDVSMTCLKNQTACTLITEYSGGYDINYQSILYLKDGGDSGGQTFYTFQGADGSRQGFTENGGICNTFTTLAAGNDACPIGYRISWAPHDNSIANSKLTAYAKMIYNPSDSNPFKTFLNAPSTSSTINTKYDAVIDRTPVTLTRMFTVSYGRTTSGASPSNCSTAGFGVCSVGSFANYPNTRTITDTSGLVNALISPAIQIKTVGKYKCTGKAYAFGTDTAYMRITVPPSSTYDATTFASEDNYGYATLLMDANIDITTPNTDITFQQKCDAQPSSPFYDASITNCSLGFASFSSYSLITSIETASLTCILLE